MNPFDLRLHAETQEGALALVAQTFNGSSACFTIKRFDNGARVGWILSYEDVVRVNERGGFSVFVEERKR
jgi:hypothetical protein